MITLNTSGPNLVKINLACLMKVIKGDALTYVKATEVSYRRVTARYSAFCIHSASWHLTSVWSMRNCFLSPLTYTVLYVLTAAMEPS